jgi:hypothetical protein
VRLALVDLPTAVLRREIEAGQPPSAAAEALLLDVCRHTLRAARRGPAPDTGR